MIYSRWWKFAVLRGEGIPAEKDGEWIDLNDIGYITKIIMPIDVGSIIFSPSNQWEQRSDGEVAVVYKAELQ